MKKSFLLVLLFVASCLAQSKLNVAVLPFTGDQTVTSDQLSFLSSKFTTELLTTQSFTVLERGKMDFILKEQGFQQSGACNSSECQVQMGQLLGVDRIVAGNLVRFGSEYAFHVDFINVGSGQIEHSVEVVREGDLQQVYKVICADAVQQLTILVQGGAAADSLRVAQKNAQAKAATKGMQVDRKGLSAKRVIALSLLSGVLGGAGAGVYFNSQGASAKTDYDDAIDALDYDAASTAYDDVQSAQTSRNIGCSVSIGSAVIGLVLWFWPEGGN